MIGDCGITHPLIDSAVAYGMVVSHSCCIYTHIIVTLVYIGISCGHVMCAAFNPRLGGTTTDLLVYIISGSVDRYCVVI